MTKWLIFVPALHAFFCCVCLKQDKLLLINPSWNGIAEKKDGESHNFRSSNEDTVIRIIFYTRTFNFNRGYEDGLYTGNFQEPDPEVKFYTQAANIDTASWLNCSIDSNVICLQYKGSNRTLSKWVEHGTYCCLVWLTCMSLRSIVRRVSLKHWSLRSIMSFRVNLDRVKVRIG